MTNVVALSEVCEITMGQAPTGESYNTDGEGLPLIAGAGDFGSLYPEAKKYTTEASKVCERGDVVLSIRATIGEKVIADGCYCLGRGVAGLRPRDGLDGRYLWHWLTHINPLLVSKGRGATFLQVNKSDIGELPIALLSLSEQRRIAAILDKADALRTKRREALAQLDRLAQSIFVEMFGDPVTNSKGWNLLPLQEATDFQEGPGILAKDFRAEGIPLVRLAGMGSSEVSLRGCNFVDPEMFARKWSHFALKEGDILVLTSATFGNPTVVGKEAVGALFYTGIIRFRPRRSDVDPTYLRQFLASPWFLRQATALASGAVIKHFGPTHLRQMTIPVPPLQLQTQFAARTAALESLRIQAKAASAAIEQLFTSIQQRAFIGGL